MRVIEVIVYILEKKEKTQKKEVMNLFECSFNLA